MLKFHRRLLGLVLLILTVGASVSVLAQGDDGPLILDDPQTSYPLGLHLEYLEDPGGSLTIEDVTRPEFDSRFTPSQKAVPNFGVTRSAYWIRFHVRNETSQDKDWLLAFSDARLGMIDFYYQPWGDTGWTHQQAGRWLPATTREYIHPHFVFPLVLSPASEGTIYLRLEASLALRVSASIVSRDVFEETNHFFFMALGLFYGIMLVMVVYNLMIFLFLRKLSYLYYSLFVTSLTISLGSIDGVVYAYLLPNWTHRYTHLIFTTLLTVLATILIRDFLELKQRSPWLNRILFYMGVICGLLLPICFLPNPSVNNLAVTAILNLQSLIIIVAIVSALMMLRNGLRAARYFLLGWLALLSNGLILNISAVGLIPSSPLYDWTYYISVALLVTLLSLALADQINVLRTDAIQAGQEVRKSEERFRATFEQAAVGIANVSRDGHFLRINQKFCDIVGYTRDEMLNLTFQEITHPDDLDADLEYVAQLNAGLIPTYSMEKRYYTKDGQVVWVDLTVSLFRKENGDADYAIAVVDDITEGKQIEQALSESEIKYRTLVEQTGYGIVVVQEGRIVFVNSAIEEASGYTVEELINRPFVDFLVEEERSRIVGFYQHRLGNGMLPGTYETVILRKGGSQTEVEVRAGMITYNGKPGDLIIIHDISERKKYEAELRRYNEHLEELVTERTRELERRQEQLAILNRSSQTINMSGLNSDGVFTAVRAACAWLVPADVVAVSLVDHATGEVEEVFLMDHDRRLPGSRYALKGSCVAEVLEGGMTLIVDDFQKSPRWPGSPPDVRSGMAVQLRGSTEVLGVLSVQSYVPNAYSDSDRSALESFAAHVSITLENIHHFKQLERTAVIEERQRLASELHDSVTQLLYSMALMSSGWGVKASQGRLPDPAGHFHQIEELSLQALKEMRMLIYQLRLPVLVEMGLLKALEDRLDKVERRVHVEAHLHVEGNLPRLSKVVEEEIYFIILEALNNSLRHAHATAVNINIRTQGNELHITVEDNGRGYDTSVPSKGMGMEIIHRRAATIAARLKVDSQPGQGTRVELVVEIEPKERIKDHEQNAFTD